MQFFHFFFCWQMTVKKKLNLVSRIQWQYIESITRKMEIHPRTENMPKYDKFASHCYYLSLSCIIFVIIISCGICRLINDLSGPLKTVFHTAKVGMDTASHNNVTWPLYDGLNSLEHMGIPPELTFFFGRFQQFWSYFGDGVYFSLSSNPVWMSIFAVRQVSKPWLSAQKNKYWLNN